MKYHPVCGLDEVGRGALAGPLVAALVCPDRPPKQISAAAHHVPIRDSKTLTHLQRQRIFQTLLASSSEIHIAAISVREINSRGIGWANKQVFINLIRSFVNHLRSAQPPSNFDLSNLEFIIDGNLNLDREISILQQALNLPHPLQWTCQTKADKRYPVVSLASIIAKQTRDQLMHQLHHHSPQYGWNTNVGYGTKTHIQALRLRGPTLHHRTLFINTALRHSTLNQTFQKPCHTNQIEPSEFGSTPTSPHSKQASSPNVATQPQ